MKNLDFIGKIQNELYLNGGFSFNLEYGFHPPKKGYMVGGLTKALTFVNIEELSKGKEKIISLLEEYAQGDKFLFLGGWKALNGTIYIEPSELYLTKDAALMKGKENKEIAIYDLKEEKDILIKGEQSEN